MVRHDSYLQRAMAVWYRNTKDGTPMQPHHAMSMEVTVEGKGYVLLANSYQVLGVYRIRSNGLLKGLKRWPKAVVVAAGWSGEE